MLDLDALDFVKGNGLVTVVAQDARSGVVLMVAHADRAALERTLESGEMHYRSRSRGPWHKGATSGNTQRVVALPAGRRVMRAPSHASANPPSYPTSWLSSTRR